MNLACRTSTQPDVETPVKNLRHGNCIGFFLCFKEYLSELSGSKLAFQSRCFQYLEAAQDLGLATSRNAYPCRAVWQQAGRSVSTVLTTCLVWGVLVCDLFGLCGRSMATQKSMSSCLAASWPFSLDCQHQCSTFFSL